MVQLNMDMFKGKSLDISTYDVISINVYTLELFISTTKLCTHASMLGFGLVIAV